MLGRAVLSFELANYVHTKQYSYINEMKFILDALLLFQFTFMCLR